MFIIRKMQDVQYYAHFLINSSFLYFARKWVYQVIETCLKICGNTLFRAKTVCAILMSLKCNIWYDWFYSLTQPSTLEAVFVITSPDVLKEAHILMSCVQKLSNIKMDKHINKINMAALSHLFSDWTIYFFPCLLFIFLMRYNCSWTQWDKSSHFKLMSSLEP